MMMLLFILSKMRSIVACFVRGTKPLDEREGNEIEKKVATSGIILNTYSEGS